MPDGSSGSMLQNYFWPCREEHFSRIRVRMENFDSKIQPFGFYYCPFFLVGRVGDEFCNTFAPESGH
jgi:hypothetical protein